LKGIAMLSAVLFACISGWLTIFCLSVYCHRAAAHRAVVLHPVVSHVMRFWLWLTTGASTRAWVAVHRKHHALVDREGDPHSPVVYGLSNILFLGYFYYRREARVAATLEKYGRDCPDDWVERRVYVPLHMLGVCLVLAFDLFVFGPAAGAVAFVVQMLWEVIWAAGVINGLGHTVGYRNFETRDSSRNIVPFGVLISGEELHNNHHRYPRSAKFSTRWYEIDVGWWFLRALAAVGLARDLYVHDRPFEEHRIERAEHGLRTLVARWREKMTKLEQQTAGDLARRRVEMEKAFSAFRRRMERRISRYRDDARVRLEAVRDALLAELKHLTPMK